MRGYFDDDEPEAERPRRDTELTLGWGALLAMFFGLVLICGVCFGLGYAVGHHTSSPAASTPAQTAAPDQEPLQGNSSIPKPSALAQAPVPPPSDAAQSPVTEVGGNPASPQQSPAAGGQSGSPAGVPTGTAQTQVRPAMPAPANTPHVAQATAVPNVHAALPAQVSLMVQIAAVANSEDANVLVSALRMRGYTVTARREPADGLIHVRIGPFNSREEADRMCTRLLNDGYNAMIQP
jgi:cell division septation protein DedD